MGNYSSCFKLESKNSKIAKLVDSQGHITLLKLPIAVAEIMLDNPGFAIAPVDGLMQTRRVSAMKADDVLLGRKVYLLVPVDKVNSRLSDLQLASIDLLVSSCNKNVLKRTRAGCKVSPIVEIGLSSESSEGLNEKFTGLAGQKNRCSKSWEPVLEPILETC